MEFVWHGNKHKGWGISRLAERLLAAVSFPRTLLPDRSTTAFVDSLRQ